MLGSKRRRFETWSRQDIVICHCPRLSYTHVHCPCNLCGYAAVSTSVEYSHWKETEALQSLMSENNTDPPSPSFNETEAPSTLASCGDMIAVESDLQVIRMEDCNANTGLYSAIPSASAVPSLANSSTESDTHTSSVNTVEMEITCAILKALNLVDQMQGSVADFEDVLTFSKELFCRNDAELEELWPRNWWETQKLLKTCGYKDPRELFICLDESHYCHWDVMETPDSLCRHCGKKGSIKYYYLGISDKIQLWCANEAMCKKMMAHWEEKGHWLQGEGANFTLKEVWDGSRFNELKWFWNPDSEWMLPVKCQQCRNVISIDEVLASPEENEKYIITCDECRTRWMHTPLYVKGDPRNIALIGHWDGWQPFGFPGTHSCGAIEVSIANMYKSDRSSTDEIYVVGFVPSYQLPKARPCALDPFLHPLITEVEDIFIDGLQVEYARSFECLPAGMMTIRALILLWTGDYPAQHEVGKFIKHGQQPCRRDKLKGTLNPDGGSTYYYGGNRYHARYPWKERKMEEELDILKEIDAEDRKSVRASKSKSCGYTGLTILYRLHKLYGFSIFNDLVIDTMHNIPTNIVAAQLKYLIQTDKIDAKLVEERLNSFPWTAELKDGRLPRGFNSRLAFWKAEELHKFAFPASELIFADLLESQDYHIWELVVRMTELVFHKRDGWSQEDVHCFENLAHRYNILIEENRGVTSCVVTAHNLIHISDDATRFSHPDNYWCFAFERAVKRYVTTKCNFKNIECSYAKREARRELLKHLAEYIKIQSTGRPYKIDLEKMSANSLDAARHLVATVGSFATYINHCNKGILVGGFQNKGILLTRQEMELIKKYVPNLQDDDDDCIAFPFKSLFKPQQRVNNEGLLYRSGECILLELENDQPVATVERFFPVEINEQYQTFVEGEILQVQNDNGNPAQFGNTGYFIVKNNASPQKIVVPVTCILRKVILYPDPHEPDQQFIVVDFERKTSPLSEYDVVIPFYPEEGEMVLINGTDPEPWIAKVLTIYEDRQIAKVLYYKKSGEKDDGGFQIDIYTPERNHRLAYDKVSWNSIITHASGEWNNNTWERPVY